MKFTKEQLWELRQEVTLNSIYPADFVNSFDIPKNDCQDFFDGYVEYLSEVAEDEEFESFDLWDIIDEYDTPDNLYNYYLTASQPFDEGLKENLVNLNNEGKAVVGVVKLNDGKFYTIPAESDGQQGQADIVLSGIANPKGIWKNFVDALECEREDLEIEWLYSTTVDGETADVYRLTYTPHEDVVECKQKSIFEEDLDRHLDLNDSEIKKLQGLRDWPHKIVRAYIDGNDLIAIFVDEDGIEYNEILNDFLSKEDWIDLMNGNLDESWGKTDSEEFSINVNGSVYIGDLCYALDDTVYRDTWGKADYEDGNYAAPNGLEFAMVGTMYGDGMYDSTSGMGYPVDAGIIGICDGGLVEKDVTHTYGQLGRIIDDVNGKVTISRDDNGTITIKVNDEVVETIYTGDYEDDEDDDSIYDYDEDDESLDESKSLKEGYTNFNPVIERLQNIDDEIDITTKEWLGSDYYYHKLLTNTHEVEKYNFRSDYWGSADSYQEKALEAMDILESYIGEEVVLSDDEDGVLECKVLGLLVDKHYSGHLAVLVEPIKEQQESLKEGLTRIYDSSKDAWYVVNENTDEEVDGPFDSLKATEDAGYGNLPYEAPRSEEKDSGNLINYKIYPKEQIKRLSGLNEKGWLFVRADAGFIPSEVYDDCPTASVDVFDTPEEAKEYFGTFDPKDENWVVIDGTDDSWGIKQDYEFYNEVKSILEESLKESVENEIDETDLQGVYQGANGETVEVKEEGDSQYTVSFKNAGTSRVSTKEPIKKYLDTVRAEKISEQFNESTSNKKTDTLFDKVKRLLDDKNVNYISIGETDEGIVIDFPTLGELEEAENIFEDKNIEFEDHINDFDDDADCAGYIIIFWDNDDIIEESKKPANEEKEESELTFLAKDEQEAIDGYDKAINKVVNRNLKKQLKHIRDEEDAHLKFLNDAKTNPELEYHHE